MRAQASTQLVAQYRKRRGCWESMTRAGFRLRWEVLIQEAVLEQVEAKLISQGEVGVNLQKSRMEGSRQGTQRVKDSSWKSLGSN